MCYWTGFNHFTVWGSILFYFGFTFFFYADIWGYEYVGVARKVMSTATFWFTMVLTVTILLVPVVAERFYYIDTRPTLTDKVRLKQKISMARTKSGDRIIRRASTMRRSTRSLQRSGYAFAHSEGFGELITTGTNMFIQQNGRLASAGSVRSGATSLPRIPEETGNESSHRHPKTSNMHASSSHHAPGSTPKSANE